ncbi:hypothetical protein HPB48_006823 [Haemaphysalis longicornis]|uniref:Uncharacterized protein n=1 Tax=Haemaphysalis longicornis TaxID=44386 RepID=A0A9J6FEB9_HAELO|nr:hypothetical protein HPB48_006823 [Haemaphysalis longicornis]
MKKLIDIKPVRASDNVGGLRCLYDTVSAHIKRLKALGRTLDTFGCMHSPSCREPFRETLCLTSDVKASRKRAALPLNSSQTHTDHRYASEGEEKGAVSALSRLL